MLLKIEQNNNKCIKQSKVIRNNQIHKMYQGSQLKHNLILKFLINVNNQKTNKNETINHQNHTKYGLVISKHKQHP